MSVMRFPPVGNATIVAGGVAHVRRNLHLPPLPAASRLPLEFRRPGSPGLARADQPSPNLGPIARRRLQLLGGIVAVDGPRDPLSAANVAHAVHSTALQDHLA